jgi:hypothetical protein
MHWYKLYKHQLDAPKMLPPAGRQHLGCILPQTVTHSLVLLKMGGIKARNTLSWLELLIKQLLLQLVGVYIIIHFLLQACSYKTWNVYFKHELHTYVMHNPI